MIKMIQKMFVWLHGDAKISENYNSKDSLDNLISILYRNFNITTLDDILKSDNITLLSFRNAVEVKNCSLETKSIEYIIKNFDGEIYNKWDGLDQVWVDFYKPDVEKLRLEKKRCQINNKILPKLIKIYECSFNSNRSYSMLLDKYDSVFLTLIETIKEMKETDTLDQESKQKIVDVIWAFVDEFESLETLYNKQQDLDQQAIKDSLKRRLDEELDLVNKIKTNWNAEFHKEEVKIEV